MDYYGRKNLSILTGIWERQIRTCCYQNAQISCKLLRNVILQPRSKFALMWEKQSRKHICIGLDRRVYFDNHHLCYYNDGFGGTPHLLYNLEDQGFKSDLLHKIWGVLLYHCHILQSPKFPEEKEVCLLVLTADGFLKILNANSGNILRSIFLSTAIKFKYLSWANYLTTVQVKSVLTTRSTARPPEMNSRVMTLAVFQIHPLKLLTCLPIERHIFGEDVTDASVNEDVLQVTHRGRTVRMYSLLWIIENCTVVKASLGEYIELNGRTLWGRGEIRAGAMGNPGFGIPCTVKLNECPPLIFSTKTSGTDISFGGCPTAYLHNPTSRHNEFHLTSLKNRELISVLKTDTLAFHPDIAEFHFDDYRRLLHISGCSLSCYRLDYSQRQELKREYAIDFRDLLQNRSYQNQLLRRTSSGRVVKRPITSLDSVDLYTSAVQDVDYENETDLLYAVVTLPDSSHSMEYCDTNFQCALYFIDERTGSILKTVPLPTWEPDGNNSIYYELDCIFHLLHHHSSSTSTCYYYRLSS